MTTVINRFSGIENKLIVKGFLNVGTILSCGKWRYITEERFPSIYCSLMGTFGECIPILSNLNQFSTTNYNYVHGQRHLNRRWVLIQIEQDL